MLSKEFILSCLINVGVHPNYRDRMYYPISITDQNDDLFVINYDKNKNEISSFKDIKGWVFDYYGNFIGRSFGHNNEIITDKLPEQRYYECFEGTVIRVFKYNGKTYITTHRKLDCSKSYFESKKTFLEMFNEAKEFDINTLEDNTCYVFFLVHPENQIINQETFKPFLIHAQTWIRVGSKMKESDKRITGVGYRALIEYQDAIEIYKRKGVLLGENYNKYTSPDISNKYVIRGSGNSVSFRVYLIAEEKGITPEEAAKELELVLPQYLKGKAIQTVKDIEEHKNEAIAYLVELYPIWEKGEYKAPQHINNFFKNAKEITVEALDKEELTEYYHILKTAYEKVEYKKKKQEKV